MAQARSLVGLDVHASKIVAAVLDAERGELSSLGCRAAWWRRRVSAPAAGAGAGDLRGGPDRLWAGA